MITWLKFLLRYLLLWVGLLVFVGPRPGLPLARVLVAAALIGLFVDSTEGRWWRK